MNFDVEELDRVFKNVQELRDFLTLGEPSTVNVPMIESPPEASET